MVDLRSVLIRCVRAIALVATVAAISGCSDVEPASAPNDEGDAVAYCSMAASIVGGDDGADALAEMVSVAPKAIAVATANAADGDRSDHARAVEAYVLEECGVVLKLGS